MKDFNNVLKVMNKNFVAIFPNGDIREIPNILIGEYTMTR